MAVGLRKVAHRLAAKQIIVQLAGDDQFHSLCRNALVVHIVSAHEALAVVTLQERIVHHV